VRARLKLAVGRVPLAYAALSLAQERKDIILCRLFDGRGPGTSVDVRAHHPMALLEYLLLLRQGWSGEHECVRRRTVEPEGSSVISVLPD